MSLVGSWVLSSPVQGDSGAAASRWQPNAQGVSAALMQLWNHHGALIPRIQLRAPRLSILGSASLSLYHVAP